MDPILCNSNPARLKDVLQDGQLLGLVTGKDILKIAPHLFEILVDKIELREEDKKPVNKFSEDEGLCQNCGPFSF